VQGVAGVASGGLLDATVASRCNNQLVRDKTARYDDGRIACDDDGVTIRWYYLWGKKTIPFRAIRSIKTFQLGQVQGRWRSGVPPTLCTGTTSMAAGRGRSGHRARRWRPRPSCITPDDVDAVAGIIAGHLDQ